MTIKITGKSSIVEQLLAEELRKKGFEVVQEARMFGNVSDPSGGAEWHITAASKADTDKIMKSVERIKSVLDVMEDPKHKNSLVIVTKRSDAMNTVYKAVVASGAKYKEDGNSNSWKSP